MGIRKLVAKPVFVIAQTLTLPILVLVAILSRFLRFKETSVGFGPEPISPFHAKALSSAGIKAKSFVTHRYHIGGDFDVDLTRRNSIMRFFDAATFRSAFFALQNFNVLFFYFHGGPIGFSSKLYWRIEAFIFRLADVKLIVMPYGGDVQDIRRNPNLLYKDAFTVDYPLQWTQEKLVARKVHYWQLHADHVLAGCDWVYYMSHWDTLCISHFAIDTNGIRKDPVKRETNSLQVLHAPNHRAIKGTYALEDAVQDLQNEGFEIELKVVEKKTNLEVIEAIENCDVIVEQLVIGWYAQFAIEAMAHGKPVISCINDELQDLYRAKGLLDKNELPIIPANVHTIKDVLREFCENQQEFEAVGLKGPDYVQKHHSLEAIGELFSGIISEVLTSEGR